MTEKLTDAIDYGCADINHAFQGALIVKSCSGNCHVYLAEPAMEWDEYQIYLWDCVARGWLEKRYVEHSIMRGQTLLRAPGVMKHWQVKRALPKGADLLG